MAKYKEREQAAKEKTPQQAAGAEVDTTTNVIIGVLAVGVVIAVASCGGGSSGCCYVVSLTQALADSRISADRGASFVMSILRLQVAMLGVMVLCDCTSVTNFRGIPMRGDSLYVSGLPPLRQNEQYTCGSACVAAVAAHWGVTLDEFKAKRPAAPKDTTGQDLQVRAESLGLQAFVFQGSLADLQDNLRQGRPLIVMITKPPDPAL